VCKDTILLSACLAQQQWGMHFANSSVEVNCCCIAANLSLLAHMLQAALHQASGAPSLHACCAREAALAKAAVAMLSLYAISVANVKFCAPFGCDAHGLAGALALQLLDITLPSCAY